MELGPTLVVAPDHPSLDDAIDRFTAGLVAESRYFGRRGAAAARPSPTLVRRLAIRDAGPRLGAMAGGQLVGLARIDERAPGGPELLIAVDAAWRRRGVALALGRALVARALDGGLPRVVLRTSHRPSDLREVGHHLGFEVFDLGRGRIDLVRLLTPVHRSA